MSKLQFQGYNPKTAQIAFSGLKKDRNLHGITDGTWSFIDGIFAVLDKTGTSEVTISTWTAANADIKHAEMLLKTKMISSLRFLVDRSFESRQYKYYQALVKTFGQNSVCFWDSHAKFALIQNGAFDVLYLTSANLNKNPRIENYSLITDAEVIGQYREMCDKAFSMLAGLEPDEVREMQKEVFSALGANPHGRESISKQASAPKRPKRSRHTKTELEARRMDALRLKLRGKTYSEIGEAQGISHTMAHNDVKKAISLTLYAGNNDINQLIDLIIAGDLEIISSNHEEIASGGGDMSSVVRYDRAKDRVLKIIHEMGWGAEAEGALYGDGNIQDERVRENRVEIDPEGKD